MLPDRPISELFAQKRPLRSLEFFPPKDDAGVESLRATATALRRMNPDFVSVTYGAGGTTRDRTAQVSALLKSEFGYTVMPHLTCVGHSRAELSEVADRIYSGVPAGLFGREQEIEVGHMSGESNVIYWLSKRGIAPEPTLVKTILATAKSRSHLLSEEELRLLIKEHAADQADRAEA